MNKSELYALMGQYLETEEQTFEDNRDQFITLAEEDIFRQVQLPYLRQNSTAPMVIGNPYLKTPGDYLSTYSMAVIANGEYEYLTSKEVSFIREVYPSPTATGKPRFFAQFDHDTFLIAPTPDVQYTVELHYFYKPASITTLGDTGTTWLSENAENALLFGSILHGYIYLKGDQDVIAMYKAQFDKAIADLKTIAEGRNRKDSYRNIDARVPV